MIKLKPLFSLILTFSMIFAPALPVMADTPLFWPSERDFSSDSGFEAATMPCIADLDGDGDLDIAVGYHDDAALRVFENLGDGTYRFSGRYASSDFFVRDGATIVAADLDGDGDLDLVGGTRSGAEIFINEGAGGFVSRGVYESGSWIEAGDLDGDGDIDLVTEGVMVLLNNGDATFQTGQYEAEGLATVADFTGDGRPDIATSGGGYWWQDPVPGQLLVNDGNGAFTRADVLPAYGRSIIAGDFDRDGDEDVFLSGWSQNVVLFNNGSGSFNAGPAFSFSADFTAGDFSGDGILDLAAVSGTEVHILIGKGDGTFSDSIQGYFGCGGAFIGRADVDGDGDLDAVLVETDGCGEIGIIKNNGDGTLADDPSITADALGFEPGSVVIGDFNGDGLNDLAAGDRWGSSLKILLNTGNGSFSAGPLYSVTDTSDLSAADLDGDGDLDLATSGVDILLNDGHGEFTQSAVYSAKGNTIDVADVDRDGDPDLVTGYVSVLLNDGDGNFAAPIEYPIDGNSWYSHEFELGDFNGDGYPDIAAVLTGWNDSSIVVLVNDRTGGFSAATTYPACPDGQASFEQAYGIAVGDVDGDGDIDIATSIRYRSGNSPGSGGKLRVLENDGTGSFDSMKTYDMILGGDADAYGIESGDFNGDGHVDFALVSCYHTVAIALNRGDGTFYNGGNYSGVCGMHDTDEIESGDLNGDGISDLVVIEDVGTDALRILLSNTGCGESISRRVKSIIAKIDAQIGEITAEGVVALGPELEGLDSLIQSRASSGCLGKGREQAMLAKTGAASASVARAAESIQNGKKANAVNMLGAGKNQLTALLNYLSASLEMR